MTEFNTYIFAVEWL